MTPIEAAKNATCDFPEDPCLKKCGVCKEKARAAVLAYLKALAEQRASDNMVLAVTTAPSLQFAARGIFTAMLRAHIAELEASK